MRVIAQKLICRGLRACLMKGSSVFHSHTFPLAAVSILLSVHCQCTCIWGSRKTLPHVDNTQKSLVWPFCPWSPWQRTLWYGHCRIRFVFSPCTSAAREMLWGKGSMGTRTGKQIQIYLHLWLSFLRTEITGFLAQVSHTDLPKQSLSCSLCHICSVAFQGEDNFAASLNWLRAALH